MPHSHCMKRFVKSYSSALFNHPTVNSTAVRVVGGYRCTLRNVSFATGKSIKTPGVKRPFREPSAEVLQSLRDGQLFSKVTGLCHYDAIRLRGACSCPQCVDPSDLQKNYVSAEIPVDIDVADAKQEPDGTWIINWTKDVPGFDEHVSRYSPEQIQSWLGPRLASRHRHRRVWKKSSFSVEDATVRYSAFIGDRQSLADVLDKLWQTGLVFISEVPTDEKSVQKLAERIGPLYNTFYGSTWDVRSVPDAKNVAYTSRYLGFHMDLLYMTDPPGIQLLHCLENTCSGGESQFADTYETIDTILSSSEGRSSFQTLSNFSQAYSYLNDGRTYVNSWPTVRVSSSRTGTPFTNAKHPDIISHVGGVYWSPPFESGDPQGLYKGEQIAITRARNHFHKTLYRPAAIVETKLPAGTCAIFDNLRVVHARSAFDVNSGRRWLRGAYIRKQDFLSSYNGVQDVLPAESAGISSILPTKAAFRKALGGSSGHQNSRPSVGWSHPTPQHNI